MSLDSVLYLAGAPSPAQMEAALVRGGLFQTASPYKAVRKVAADAILVSLFAHSAPFPIFEEIGLEPQRVALFSCTDKARSGVWTEMTVRGLVALLHAFEGDALFLHAPDRPALMRKGDTITIDPRCGLWAADVAPRVLALIDLPYVWGVIPIE